MRKTNLFAVIDLGASAIRMVIAEQRPAKSYTIIESLTQSIRLGVDTFLTSKISQESAMAAAKILKKFKRVLDDYQVTNYRVVATSAVSEAQNREFFRDFIQRETGFKINIIEGQESCKMIFLAALKELEKSNESLKGNTLLVDLGTGNARAMFIQNGQLIWKQTLKLGSLRLREILQGIDVQSFDFHKVLHAFIKADLDLVQKLAPLKPINRLIATGSMINEIIQYSGSGNMLKKPLKVPADWFFKVFEKYKNMTVEQLVVEKGIPAEKADILLPAITVYWYFAKIFSPECIIAIDSNFAEGVVREHLGLLDNFDDHIITAARLLGRKYGIDENHAQQVMKLAEDIFKETRSLHKLPKDYLLILKVAALLHDIGHFINDSEHHKHSQYIINTSSLTGLTNRQRGMVALVARNHRHYPIKLNKLSDIFLTDDERIDLKKLISILRIANSLDQSHGDRVKAVKVRRKKNRNQLVFTINVNSAVYLEKWSFSRSVEIFEQLFYHECLLTEKREF